MNNQKKKKVIKKPGKKYKSKKKGMKRIIRHEREGNLNYYSEEIATFIIDKIIILSIAEHHRHLIDSGMGEICFVHLKKEISNFLQTQFIPYDRDDMNITYNISNSKWLHILTEDNNTISPLYTMTNKEKITNIFSSKIQTIFYDISLDKKNFWGEIPSPISPSKDRNASCQIEYNTNISAYPLKNEQIFQNNSENINKMEIKNKKLLNTLLNKNGDFVSIKRKIFPIKNFQFYDIPSHEFQKINELPEIIKLREENEQKLKEIKEEKMRLLEIEKKNTNLGEKKVKKPLKNFTVDVKGKIVLIKEIPIEKLKNEFTSARSDYKDINSIPYSSSRDCNFMLKEKIKEYNIKTNNIDTLPKKKTLYTKPDKPITLREKKELKSQIIPSGSSFRLIKPEIGVTIIEDHKIKTGGKDFFSKFNKNSINNYNKTDREPLQFKQLIRTEDDESFNSFAKEKNFLNSKIDSTHLNNNSNIIYNNQSSQQTSNKIKLEGEKERNRKLHKSQSTGNLNLTSQSKFNSLKEQIDLLDLLQEKEEFPFINIRNNSQKGNNLILGYKNKNFNKERKVIKKTQSTGNFDEMDKFTRTIMTNNFWGNTSRARIDNNVFIKKRFKHQKKELIREIGLNITATKLPRDRIKKIAQEILIEKKKEDNKTKYLTRKDFFQAG